MDETRDFDLGDILSITTGLLVSPRHIGGVYDILNWMTGENLYTHQLGRAAEAAKPVLLERYPKLADVWIPREIGADGWMGWLDGQKKLYGHTLPVPKIPEGKYRPMGPIEEAQAIRPNAVVAPPIVVNVSDQKPS